LAEAAAGWSLGESNP